MPAKTKSATGQTFTGALQTATAIAAQHPAAVEAPIAARGMLEVAESLVIDSPAMLQIAANELADIVARGRKLEETRKTITKPMDEAKKAVMDLFRPAVEMIERAERMVRTKVAEYSESERKRVAAERAESERIAREEREQKEHAAREAEKAERDAIKSGDSDAAIAAREAAEQARNEADAAAFAPPPPVVMEAKADGLSIRRKWKARVTDSATFLLYVAEHPDLQHLFEVDMTALNQLAVATKGAMEIPGVHFYEETISAVR